MKKLSFIICTSLLSACTWVELNNAGKRVTIGTEKSITNCKKVGDVNAKTRYALIAGAPRSEEKVRYELSVLARNEAAKIGANTLTPSTPANNGQQSFVAYLCP